MENIKGGYCQVAWVIMRSTILTPSDKLVLSYLLCKFNPKKGEAWPSFETIGGSTGIAPRSAQRSVDRLIELNLLTKLPNKHRSNGYILDFNTINQLGQSELTEQPKEITPAINVDTRVKQYETL